MLATDDAAINRRANLLWGDVDRETQRYGLATPGGVISSTGVGGLSIHGGLGWLRRTYGYSVDNILSAEIVTADGIRLDFRNIKTPIICLCSGGSIRSKA